MDEQETPSHVSETISLVDKMIAQGLAKRPTLPVPAVGPGEQAPPTLPEQASIGASEAVATLPVPDIQVTAENADEMVACQRDLIGWTEAKIAELAAQAIELKTAFEHARDHGWKYDTLERHWKLAIKRQDFYERMLTALVHGYQIVPSFPITAFAIRTDKNKPLKMMTTWYSKSHTQEPSEIPAGEGDYKNPFPVVSQRTTAQATATTGEKCQYWAREWKDMEFPLSMSKPRIMEAATRAMALKIFDDIGILPGYAPNEGTRAPRGDPLIIARLMVPKQYSAENRRWVSFIIAWHLDTRTI